MRSILFLGATLFVFVFLSVDAQGQTSIDLEAIKDNTMFQVPNIRSNGAGPELYAGVVNNGSSLERRALIQFDLESIPSNATITNVELKLYCFKVSSSGNSNDFRLHRVLESWGEESSYSPNGQGVTAAIGDATWRYRFYDFPNEGTLWIDQGGSYEDNVSAVIPVNEKNSFYTWSSEQLVDDVQDMLENPDENFGWILKASDEDADGTGRAFASRENEDSSKRPVLTISFSLSTATDDGFAGDDWGLYPTMADNYISLEKPDFTGSSNYQIVDNYGKIVLEGELNNPKKRINVSTLHRGLYLIRISDASHKPIKWFKI